MHTPLANSLASQIEVSPLKSLNQTTLQLPRILAFSAVAAGITFGLFVGMQKLIDNKNITQVKPTPHTVITLHGDFDETPIITKPKVLPEPKQQQKPEPLPKLIETKTEQNLTPGLFSKSIQVPSIKPVINPTMGDGGDARPIVRIEPKYPASAARDGIQGWVRLTFSITPQGTTDNIRVVESEPRRVFDQAAKRALSKWKYKPNMSSGQAMTQQGMQVQLDFLLED